MMKILTVAAAFVFAATAAQAADLFQVRCVYRDTTQESQIDISGVKFQVEARGEMKAEGATRKEAFDKLIANGVGTAAKPCVDLATADHRNGVASDMHVEGRLPTSTSGTSSN